MRRAYEVAGKPVCEAALQPFEVFVPSVNFPVERLREDFESGESETEEAVVVVLGVNDHDMDVTNVVADFSFIPGSTSFTVAAPGLFCRLRYRSSADLSRIPSAAGRSP